MNIAQLILAGYGHKALGNCCFNTKKEITIDAEGRYFCVLPKGCEKCGDWEFCSHDLANAVARYKNFERRVRV